jgi:HlyD family secretion protein
VRAAEPIMFIQPSDSDFVITARVEPIHVDEVFVGQEATLRFSAFSSRTTPEINGHVTNVSADALTDEKTGRRYYPVELEIDPGELDKLEGLTLVPGMPVEAYIRTDDRTPLNYLVKPLSDYFARSMRES